MKGDNLNLIPIDRVNKSISNIRLTYNCYILVCVKKYTSLPDDLYHFLELCNVINNQNMPLKNKKK